MKLLCVSPSYWPAFKYGGPIPAVHGLNRALVRKGVDLTTYTTNVGLEGEVPVNKEVNVDGVKVTYFKYTKFFEFTGATGWQFSLHMFSSLRRNLKLFDLVHVPAIWNFPTAATCYHSKKYAKPYIISPHGALDPYTINKKSWKKRPYYLLFSRRHLNNAKAIHYLTEFEMRRCHQALGMLNLPVVVPNGVDLQEFDNLPNKRVLRERYPFLKNKIVILFLGRIHWIKGLDILLKAIKTIATKRDDVHLFIVGNDEGGFEVKVRQWVKELGLETFVTFTGLLSGREKLEVLSGSDIFALPSSSEGFSMAILEAMACRLPVIITHECHFPEVSSSQAGIAVDPNTEQLAEALRRLIDYPELRRRMGENARDLVEERYTWDKVAGQMKQIYDEILGV